MGWAKYDEDIREIVEERRVFCRGYNNETSSHSFQNPTYYSSSSNRTVNNSGFYSKYYAGSSGY